MKFGTVVLIERGGGGKKGIPGSRRYVRGVLIGTCKTRCMVRLLEDDPLDTVGWNKKGDVGWWERSQIMVMPIAPLPSLEKISSICRRTGFQQCHMCDDFDCCDNLNEDR